MKGEHQTPDGVEATINAFQAALLRYAARLLNNVTLAQDAVQNAFVKLSRREPPPDGPSDEVRNWLFRVTHNEAVDLIRAEESRRRTLERFARQQACETDDGLCYDTGADERETLVLACLPVLTPLQRQVVLLRLQQGLDYEAIATITGQKSGYVGNLLHHAVKALAAEVKRREGGSGHVSA
ncbi:MAG TPA: sigma-70 family RNA polymerase sigma factor [Kiritimatiellia bacterium]|nr:sigma-70 family RNA polymerase sigma factor [Kiritimatiellia bacterium]